MKVLHLSAYDTGGAANVALRLHRNIAAQGVESRFWVLRKKSDAEDVTELGFADLTAALGLAAGTLWQRAVQERDHYFPRGSGSSAKQVLSRLESERYRPDVLICHWMSRFLSSAEIADIARTLGVPIIWYFHDMNAYTGGCHYAWECRRYEEACGRCEAIYSGTDVDISRRQMADKIAAFANINVVGVAFSARDTVRARRSRLFHGRRVETILPAIDATVFTPGEGRLAARRELGWPDDSPILLAGALYAERRRKGGPQLVAALRQLVQTGQAQGVRVALVGQSRSRSLFDDAGVPIMRMGTLSPEALARLYRAADAFVCPTLQDAGPMMIGESMSCGTPVVAFDVGIASSLIDNGRTGFLVSAGDVNALASAIGGFLALSKVQREQLRAGCLARAEVLHPDVQARRFIELLEATASRLATPCFSADAADA